MREVDQPRARHRWVEDRVGDVYRRRCQTDDRAVGGRTERKVQIQADQVALHALAVCEIPCPVVGLFEQLLVGAAHVEAGQMRQDGVSVGCLAGGGIHRLGAQRAGPVPPAVGVRLAGAGRRVERGHQMQPRHGR